MRLNDETGDELSLGCNIPVTGESIENEKKAEGKAFLRKRQRDLPGDTFRIMKETVGERQTVKGNGLFLFAKKLFSSFSGGAVKKSAALR